MTLQYAKPIRKKLRELAGLAHGTIRGRPGGPYPDFFSPSLPFKIFPFVIFFFGCSFLNLS